VAEIIERHLPWKINVSWPISRVLSWTIIHLDDTSPYTSSDLPGYTMRVAC